MPEARIAELQLNPEADWTHINLWFSTDRGVTWQEFYTTGSSLEDLPVSVLENGVLTVDGVNSPAGTEAAASYAGNIYRHRGKTAAGYGNKGKPFKALDEEDDYGPLADGWRLLQDFADIKVGLDFADDAETDAYVAGLLIDAMDELRGDAEIDALYTGSHTTAQGRVLARAERYLAMSLAFEKAMAMRALGQHPPLLMEPSADLQDRAEYYAGKAETQMLRLKSGTNSRRLARPMALSSGIGRQANAGARRNALLTENAVALGPAHQVWSEGISDDQGDS